MSSQISLNLNDVIILDDINILKSDILIDRGSRYGYCISKVTGKNDIKNFLNIVKNSKPFDSASHLSYAFRIRSGEGILVEGKSDDGEVGSGQIILRELKRKNIEQIILVISRHFGGIYLQNDRFKNIIDVSKMALNNL